MPIETNRLLISHVILLTSFGWMLEITRVQNQQSLAYFRLTDPANKPRKRVPHHCPEFDRESG
jgi:hypothetical protein